MIFQPALLLLTTLQLTIPQLLRYAVIAHVYSMTNSEELGHCYQGFTAVPAGSLWHLNTGYLVKPSGPQEGMQETLVNSLQLLPKLPCIMSRFLTYETK